MRIEVPEDSGNVEVVDAAALVLRVRPDRAAAFRHWFHFRVDGARGRPIRLRLVDLATTSYPEGWEGFAACGSSDGVSWARLPTTYAAGELQIDVVPASDALVVAAFAPYPYARHRALVARAAERCAVEGVGRSVEGRPIEVLTVGRGPVPVWVVARQHPGETMAEWFVEGLLDRLLDDADPLAAALRGRATFRIAPNLNPDGTVHGNLRTNAVGTDLNRSWVDPAPDRAPEVRAVLDAMDRTGVALALDVHGDEVIPYPFVAGPEGTPSWDADRQARLDRFSAAWMVASPDFQTVHGYPRDAPGEANMTICTNQLSERFRCLALTVEQPFKDVPERPGWLSERAKALGASVLEPIAAVLP